MKKITAILIAMSIFLAQINIINAQEFIPVAGNCANIDFKNDILYVSSPNVAVRDLEHMLNGEYTVCAYTDSVKSDPYNGYLTTGNLVTLTKGNESIDLLVKDVTPYNIDENFENINNGSKPYDLPGWSWNGDLGVKEKDENGEDVFRKTGYSQATYEGLNASDTNKRVKFYINDTAGVTRDLYAHSRNRGIKGPAVLSLDMLNATPNNGAIYVQLGNNKDNWRSTLISIGRQISYGGSSSKEDNTNSTELKRMQALLDPFEKKVKIYYGGELKSENSLDSLDFSDFTLYIYCKMAGERVQEFTAYIDNLKFYENASLDENYAIKVADYQKNGKSLGDLHSGNGKITVDIENITNKNSELTLYACKYTGKKLTDVLGYKNITISSDNVSESIDINTGNCTDDDIVKVMIWEKGSNKPVYNQDIFMKNIVFKPFADEIVQDFNNYNKENMDVHPRILIDNDDLERISKLKESNATVKKWYDDVIRHANAYAQYDMDSYIRYVLDDAGIRILPVCKDALKYLLALGLANFFEQDKKYVAKAVEILDNVCGVGDVDFPDWNDKRHALDTGLMAQVVAIGYDWFYDDLTETQKKNYETAMIEKGIQKGFEWYEAGSNVAWWIDTDSNWNADCNGGLMMAAMAIFDKYPDISSDMLEKGINNLQYCIDASYPDGGWFEGPTYGLGATYALALVIDSLESTFGKDYGLTQILGFDRVGDFIAHIEGPCAINNFSDAGEGKIDNDVVFWLANTFGKYENALNQVERQEEILEKEESHPLAVIWCSEEILKAQKAQREKDAYFKGVEAVTMREDWNDPDSLWLSFCGGNSIDTHSHLDCGAFVLDWGGYRWACDLGADNYDLPDYYFNAYRTRAEGHNTLVINPGKDGGQVRGTAVVTEKSLNVDNPYAIVDLSPVYVTTDDKSNITSAAASVKRGFKLLDNRTSVFIRDEIELTKESDIYWFMHSKADLTKLDGRSVLMSNGDKSMVLEFVTDAEINDISIVNAEPMETSPTVAKQDTNKDYKKIQIHMKDSGSVKLTVSITPLDDGVNHTPLSQISDLENWGD